MTRTPKEPTANGRDVSENEANAIADMSEDFPQDPPPTENLPHVTQLEAESAPKHKGKDGIDKAMDILDEYEEGVPPRNPNVPHHEE